MNEILHQLEDRLSSTESTVSTEIVQFPCRIIERRSSSERLKSVGILVCHGLAEKSHDTDDWTPLLITGAAESSLPFSNMIYYTARGHGETSGWQDTTDTDPDQFTWPRLAEDMVAIADSMRYSSCIVVGESMGSSTAFYAALQDPGRVKAVIMMRPPTAWETRAYQREHLESKARQLEATPSTRFPAQFHKVLRATAKSDYPPLTGPESAIYNQLQCPVLLLAVRHDLVHPVSTAEALLGVLPHAELHVVEDHAEAIATWPLIIKTFLDKIDIENSI